MLKAPYPQDGDKERRSMPLDWLKLVYRSNLLVMLADDTVLSKFSGDHENRIHCIFS
jgi:hypothetical protein